MDGDKDTPVARNTKTNRIKPVGHTAEQCDQLKEQCDQLRAPATAKFIFVMPKLSQG